MSNTFHVALYVEDLAAAVAEYRKILGIGPGEGSARATRSSRSPTRRSSSR